MAVVHPCMQAICRQACHRPAPTDLGLTPCCHSLPHPQSDLAMRLARRVPKSPEDFEQAVQLAEQRWVLPELQHDCPCNWSV